MNLRLLTVFIALSLFAGPVTAQSNDGEKKLDGSKYAVWAIAPVHLFESIIGTSVSYEHGIDPNGIITYTALAMGGVDLTKRYNSSRASGDGMFFVMPGLKFYPTGSMGRTKYAIGPSMVVGFGQKTDYDSNYPSDRVSSRFILGVLLSNSLNYRFSHVYLGIDYGLGFSYMDRYDGRNQGSQFINQLAIKIGYIR